MRLWLASASPRRHELLTTAGYAVDVHPSNIDEAVLEPIPEDYAVRIAREKAQSGPKARVVVAADTVVHRGPRIWGKPAHRDEAIQFLQELAEGPHRVTTGVCVRRDDDERSFSVTTEVRFRQLHLNEILAYVATGEADDKAGAYGIQGRGGALVADVRGSWTNVMGLPLEVTIAALSAFGVPRF